MRRIASSMLLLVVAGLAIGCTNRPDRYDQSRNETTPPPVEQAPVEPTPTDTTYTGSGDPGAPAADNTAMNQRDQSAGTVTPMDQAENPADRAITQGIRKVIVADRALSTNAKNVKIVTANGVVTLRGPVNTEQERATVAEKAHQVAGVTRVDNQLEVINQ